MGTLVMIQGESGTGKSTSMRNLCDRISLINVAGKRLPFRGKIEKTINSDDIGFILRALGQATSDIIVIDDVQYIMAHSFFARRAERGYDKFSDIGGSIFDLIRAAQRLPDSKRIYFLWHTEQSDFGRIKAKTLGKMLDDKLVVEGEFPIVLRTVVQDGHYYFSTRNNGNDSVKTPLDMFSAALIDNDIAIVDKAICDYYGLEPAKDKQADKKDGVERDPVTGRRIARPGNPTNILG